MSTIVADADDFVKCGKSGVLPALLSATRVLVPRAVWGEAVEEGKRGMHEDARVLERVLTQGVARIGGAPLSCEQRAHKALLGAIRYWDKDRRRRAGRLQGLDRLVNVHPPPRTLGTSPSRRSCGLLG